MFNWLREIMYTKSHGDIVSLPPQRKSGKNPNEKKCAKVIKAMGELYVFHPANRVKRMEKRRA